MNTRRRSIRHLTAVSLAVAISVLVTACGGSSKPPAPSGNASKQGSGAESAYRYSACMRTHGVTNFQDPHVSTNGDSVTVGIRVNPSITGASAFKSAQKACAHILPGAASGPTPAQQRARTAAILAFARCMRGHGFPKFPGPTRQGQITPAMLSSAGVDLQQPAIRPAAYACVATTHGVLTRADINQALAHASGPGAQSGG